MTIEWKWTDHEYHLQNKVDVNNADVKISCDITKFPELIFFGTKSKPHGVRGLRKHYHHLLETKMGHGTFTV